MDITRRCDYALRILEAAYESGDSYVSVADISEQEDIPYAFARSIQHDLVKGGLIKTVRGARGGLALGRHRVLQIEGQRIGGAGQGLVEQLRPRARDGQLATHGGAGRRGASRGARAGSAPKAVNTGRP